MTDDSSGKDVGDNPPALPSQPLGSDGFPVAELENGMSLRDYFAIRAPEPAADQVHFEQQLDRSRNLHNDSYKPKLRDVYEIKAELAYRYADVMLEARRHKGSAHV